MKSIAFAVFVVVVVALAGMVRVGGRVITENAKGETTVRFGFQTENGQQRSENITYNITDTGHNNTDGTPKKTVEYRGDFSFISADGYEYLVKYKANKNGFQPYVTAHKVQTK